MIWVELNYIRQVYESLWLFKNYNQFMVNTLKKVMLVWLILIYNFLPHEFPCEMVMTHITEMKEGGVLVDSATSLCWYLFSPYLSPSCINEVTGKGKITFLIMVLKEENNKWAKPHVRGETPMHVEIPRNSISRAWKMG